MKKIIQLITLFLFVGLLASGTAYILTKNQIVYAIAVAVGTTFYHFAMRLTVACTINAKFHNRMDYTKRWFQQRKFEPELYRRLGVKKWKKRLPAFHPDDFLMKKRSAAEMMQATCQAEIVHEIIMALSFVPVTFSLYFGALEVFVITSCVSFLFDGIFVIAQRYNRPRLLRLLKKKA